MSNVQLLGKTEIWMQGVRLANANLPDIARAAANVLSIAEDKVFVTDVREALVVLDVLEAKVEFESVVGKQEQVFDALKCLGGVSIDDNATIHSEGVLGVIGSTRKQAEEMVDHARRMDEQIRKYASGRVAVVSTGPEVLNGEIEDTNFDAISRVFAEAGFEVSYGGIAGDSEREIAGLVARLAGEGFGLIITTGGVGAEDKDHTIEAIEDLDPDLSTAVLAKYKKGTGRHVKDSVRVCVASMGWATIICLPGPTHEVELALPVILKHLQEGTSPARLAEAIAVPIRATLPVVSHHHHHHH